MEWEAHGCTQDIDAALSQCEVRVIQLSLKLIWFNSADTN